MTAGVHPSLSLPSSERASRATPAPAAPADPGPVVVPEAARFQGLLTFRGRAQVNGELEGEILAQGCVRVGERGRVVGSIEADEVIVAGELEGDAVARDRLELTGSARVRGSIRAPRIHLADGCVLEGRCESGGSDPAAPGPGD